LPIFKASIATAPITSAIKVAAIAAMATALSACSGRNTDLSEKLAAVEAAAIRAERAADRAEKAAKAAESHPIAEAADEEIQPEDDGALDDGSNPDPNSSAN